MRWLRVKIKYSVPQANSTQTKHLNFEYQWYIVHLTIFFFEIRPIIDYDVALIMEPMTLVGTIIGVYGNKIFPSWLITFLLVILLSFTTYRTIKKVNSPSFIIYSWKETITLALSCSYFFFRFPYYNLQTSLCKINDCVLKMVIQGIQTHEKETRLLNSSLEMAKISKQFHWIKASWQFFVCLFKYIFFSF